MSDKNKEAFEKWAFDYLKGQYSFYNSDAIRDLIVFNKPPHCYLRAAFDFMNAYYAPMRKALESISDEGWYAHSNNASQLVEILDEHKRAADEALGINKSSVQEGK